MTLPDDFFKKVHGFITLPEAELLYKLASQMSNGSNIVEIGAYQGRSTIALALGAKVSGATVWSIDHHPDYEIMGTHFGMSDNQAYYRNLADYSVGDVVRTINLSSVDVFRAWTKPVDLLFIDGSHEFDAVHRDWMLWSSFTSMIALHDTAGHHPGVNQLVQEVLDSGNWERVEVVDSISLFKFKE